MIITNDNDKNNNNYDNDNYIVTLMKLTTKKL